MTGHLGNTLLTNTDHVTDHVTDAQDPCWQRLKKPLHLVDCIHVLLSGYVDDLSAVPAYNR